MHAPNAAAPPPPTGETTTRVCLACDATGAVMALDAITLRSRLGLS